MKNAMEVDRMIRDWGEWEVLHSLGTTKIKKITINPGCELSYHKHAHRNESWFIHQGHGVVLINADEKPKMQNEELLLEVGKPVFVSTNTWHQLVNVGKEPLVIIELQYGEKCIEDDIERKDL